MIVLQPTLGRPGAIWRLRWKIAAASVAFIVAELLFFAFRNREFDALVAGGFQGVGAALYAARFAVLLGTCAIFYALLEAADRFHIAAAMGALGIALFPLTMAHTYVLRLYAASLGMQTGGPNTLIFAADYWLQLMLVWSSAVLATFYHVRVKREQDLRLAASSSAHRSRMRAVRYRLNPHFLFNTLNSIGLLALERKGEAASGLIDRLAAFLRSTLHAHSGGFHSLGQEFQQMSDYLDIEKVRFPDRLIHHFECERGLESTAVPPFILQPLIESAIQNGVSQERGGAQIELSARREGESLVIEVTQRVSRGGTEPARAPAQMGALQTVQDDLPAGYTVEVTTSDAVTVMTVRGPYLLLNESAEARPHG